MRDIYKNGFDFSKIQPISVTGGAALVEGIVPSDFKQIIGTDHLDEMRHCKIWKVISLSNGVTQIKKGDTVIILKAGIDGIDPDMPKYGIVDVEDIRAKLTP